MQELEEHDTPLKTNFFVFKRNLSTEPYSIDKIRAVLKKAFKNTKNVDCNEISFNKLITDIDNEIKSYIDTHQYINIEDIQDIIENCLMKLQFYETAKHLIQFRYKRNQQRKNINYIYKIPDNVKTPWGVLGYITYKRTYARRLNERNEVINNTNSSRSLTKPSNNITSILSLDDQGANNKEINVIIENCKNAELNNSSETENTLFDNNKTEEFRDTILRVLDASQKQLNVGFSNKELNNAYKYLMGLKCSVAGRFLWQLGTKTVERIGLMSLQNCAFVKIDSPIEPFLWIFDSLMLGTGVGFSIENHNINKIPKLLDNDINITRLDTKDANFIIPDSREGWVFFLERVLEAFFIKGIGFTYSTLLIRGAGSIIKGFGGTASGPEDLVKGVHNIVEILKKRRGEKLTSVNCLDIINIIATIVVAGNVRRSALIALGDYDDIEYLNAKRWDLGNIPNWRCMSNNSVICDDTTKLPPEFWFGYEGGGEPYGLVNINLSKKIGRTKDGEKYPDPLVEGYNPCFVGNTLIAVADGRGAVPIKQLAEEGKDVPVYSVNKQGIVEIKWGRNPRITGLNQKIVKITLDDNTCVQTTLNHKFRLNDGTLVEAKDLQPKMSLTRFTKTYEKANQTDKNTSISVNTNTLDNRKNKCFEHDLFHDFYTNNSTNLNKNQSTIDIENAHHEACLEGKKQYIDPTTGYKVFTELAHLDRGKCCGNECRHCPYDHCNVKSKSQNPTITLNTTNLPTLTINGILHVTKQCEKCNSQFNVPLSKREVSYCSINCGNSSFITLQNPQMNTPTQNIFHNQIMIYKDLKDTLQRKPLKTEWESMCKKNHIPSVIDAKNTNGDYTFQSYEELENTSIDYNHRVKSIEFLETTETVYNITVDNNHTIGIFTTFDNFIGNGIFVANCGEQSLSNLETCCLGEIFLPNINSYSELKDVAKTIYRICKHSLLLPCHQKGTEAIVHKNMRMGIGMTGIMMATDEQRNWMEPLYEYLREFDKEYSKKIGCNTSIKLTTVKPSGTLSLLAGVTSGAHPGIYQYFIRRIRISSNSPLIELCRKNGYKIEYQRNFDGSNDLNTTIVEFPCKYPDGTKLANSMTAIDQLKIIKDLQYKWSDNAVSVTIYYRLHELKDIQDWLAEHYTNTIKSVSFLLHNEHGFSQAPFEEITKEQYELLLQNTIPITSGNIDNESTVDNTLECSSGFCPVR
jgi:hypothetical protein